MLSGLSAIRRPPAPHCHGLTAEGLIRMLYLGTLFQVFQDGFEIQIGLACSFLECSQVLRIIGQPEFDGFIDQLRNRSICVCRLEAQRPMEVWIEIDSGSFLCIFHGCILTP